MRRDLRLLRAILLAAADGSVPLHQIAGAADAAFAYHVGLLAEMGLCHSMQSPGGVTVLVRLTAYGHEDAEVLRGDEAWTGVLAHFALHGCPEGMGPWDLALEIMRQKKRLQPPRGRRPPWRVRS